MTTGQSIATLLSMAYSLNPYCRLPLDTKHGSITTTNPSVLHHTAYTIRTLLMTYISSLCVFLPLPSTELVPLPTIELAWPTGFHSIRFWYQLLGGVLGFNAVTGRAWLL